MRLIAKNKKAYFDYDIHETLEAGIVLTGDEVKSLRTGNVSMIGAFANIFKGELYLVNCRIAPYEQAYRKDEEKATQRRKLLVHRKELSRLVGDISRKGITVVPLRMYFNKRNIVKVELGIAKHKKAAGKKKELKERDIKREAERELRGKE